MLVAYLQQQYDANPKEDLNVHAANVKKRGLLWHVDDIHINASPDFHILPATRSSSWKKYFHTAYADLITRIATKTAITLQQSNTVHLTSFVALSSRACKGRLMPSFAADPATEMRLIEQEPSVTGAITHRQVKDLAVRARTAAQAKLNITNQLLYAQMHGCRTFLASMGVNGISSNCLRLREFVRQYHEQHVRLDVVIRLRLTEKKPELRNESLDKLCPFLDGQQFFGFYTSDDFLACHHGQVLDTGLAVWQDAPDRHYEKSVVTSELARMHSGQRTEHIRRYDVCLYI